MRNFVRPRYLSCWWCSRKLRGRAHELMTGPGHADPVVVHCDCAEDMQRDGWQLHETPIATADDDVAAIAS